MHLFCDLDNCHKTNTIGKGVQTDQLFQNIKTWKQCSQKCKDKTDCIYWNWYTNKHSTTSWYWKCKLLSSLADTEYNIGVISGDRGCGL